MDMAGSEFMEVSQLPYYSGLALFSKPTSFGTVTFFATRRTMVEISQTNVLFLKDLCEMEKTLKIRGCLILSKTGG